MRLISLFCFFVLSIGSAHAQTAEETVAYILFNAENGATTGKLSGNEKDALQLTSGSPANFEGTLSGDGYKSGKLLFNVQKINGCQYVGEFSHTIDGKISTSIKVTAHFLADVEVESVRNNNSYYNALKSVDSCAFKISGFVQSTGVNSKDECSSSFVMPLLEANNNRALKALSYLRQTYCKGRAF